MIRKKTYPAYSFPSTYTFNPPSPFDPIGVVQILSSPKEPGQTGITAVTLSGSDEEDL
jgi:hypothetical protein